MFSPTFRTEWTRTSTEICGCGPAPPLPGDGHVRLAQRCTPLQYPMLLGRPVWDWPCPWPGSSCCWLPSSMGLWVLPGAQTNVFRHTQPPDLSQGAPATWSLSITPNSTSFRVLGTVSLPLSKRWITLRGADLMRVQYYQCSKPQPIGSLQRRLDLTNFVRFYELPWFQPLKKKRHHATAWKCHHPFRFHRYPWLMN